jgi:hypothetical protein
MATNKSLDLNVTNAFGDETLLAVGEAIVAHVNGLNATEIAARSNADAANLAALQAFVQTATARMNLIENKADTLTGGEFGQLEDVILEVLSQPGFASLLSGLSVSVGGNSYAMASVVNALATAAAVTGRTQSNVVGGIPRTLTLTTDGGMSFVFTATESVTPAVLDPDTGAVVSPKLVAYTYSCSDFMGVPASQVFVFSAKPVLISGLSLNAESKAEVSRTYILIDLASQFSAAPTVTLNTPDLNADGTVGTISPLAVAMQALATALALRDQRASAATVAGTDAVTARSVANAAALTLANQQNAASVSLPIAQAAVAQAESDLADAQAGGDQGEINAAQSALNAANQAVTEINTGVSGAQSLANSTDATAVTAEIAAAAATAALATAQTAVDEAQAAVDALA